MWVGAVPSAWLLNLNLNLCFLLAKAMALNTSLLIKEQKKKKKLPSLTVMMKVKMGQNLGQWQAHSRPIVSGSRPMGYDCQT